jgi:hypothetical protein
MNLENYPPQKAARLAGASLIIMFILAIISQFLIFTNIIVVGDTSATISNMKASGSIFWIGVLAWILIYALDVVVSIGLYVLFKSTNNNQAKLSAALRLIYTGIVFVGLIALILYYPSVYDLSQLIAYIFFIGHLFLLGYLVYKSDYIPKWLGFLLMIGSISYVILTYGEYFIPQAIYEPLFIVSMIPATFGELSLAIWLVLRANKIS